MGVTAGPSTSLRSFDHSAMGVTVHPPISRVLPRHLLADPEVRQALARRDFRIMLLAAHAAELSFNAIADATGIKAERISKVARGTARFTAMETVERIADGLHIPGEMLGLATRPWETEPAPPGGKEDPVDRRDVLRGTLAAALAGITPALADADQALAYTGPTPDDLTTVEAAAEKHSRGYRGRAPATVLGDLVDELAAAAPLLRQHQPRTSRTTITHALGQLGGLTAIVLHDLGRHREAYQAFATAARAAKASRDQQLHAWVLARKAMVPLNFGAPQVAARVAEQARALAGTSETAAAALAASVAGRAYALLHDRDAALAALTDADIIAGRLTGAQAADTWIGYCPQKHHVHRSQAMTALGETTEARTAQQTALTLTAPTSTMTRTLLLLDAAACDHRDGDSLGACRTAADALTSTPGFRDGLVHHRGVELYQSIPAQLRGTHAGRQLADALAS